MRNPFAAVGVCGSASRPNADLATKDAVSPTALFTKLRRERLVPLAIELRPMSIVAAALHLGTKAGVLRRFHHFFDLDALLVERKPVGHARFWVVETKRDFIDFVASVTSSLLHAVADPLSSFLRASWAYNHEQFSRFVAVLRACPSQ